MVAVVGAIGATTKLAPEFFPGVFHWLDLSAAGVLGEPLTVFVNHTVGGWLG